MPQSTLYWIIGIIIVVLVILIIATAVRSSRRREEAVVDAAPHPAAQPAATTAAATQGGALGATDDRHETASDVDADARRAERAEVREETPVAGAATFDAQTAEKKPTSGSTAAPRPAAASDDVVRSDAEARPASALSTFDAAEVDRRSTEESAPRSGAADAAPLGLAAAGVAGGTGVTVDEADAGVDLPAPLGASTDADRAAVPGVAGGEGVAVDKAEDTAEDATPELSEEEAPSRPVAGLPGMPGRVEVTEEQRRAAEAETGTATPSAGHAPSDAPAQSVPGTTPLTGEDALIEAPEHAHEAPEPIYETPAYIQDSTTGQDPTKDLAEGEVYGTTPLTGEDAVIEARADVAEAADSTDSTDSAERPGAEDRTERTERRLRPAAPATEHVAVPGVAGGDGVQVDSARPARSRFEAIKETVVDTAGTVVEKAAPVAGSAARTVGKAAGTVASTLKDKLADAQRRRWGRK